MTSVVALPASFAQERFWFLEHLSSGASPHNIQVAIELAGPLDVDAFRAAFLHLVSRHEALRTTLRTVEGTLRQVIAATVQVAMPLLPSTPEQAVARAGEQARQRFRLADGPLFRTELLQTGPERVVWLLTLHHAICDGWSVEVLLDELGALYRGESLPGLPLQYADYAVWQRSLGDGSAFWVDALAGAPRLLELPADRNRPRLPGHQGALLFPEPLPAGLGELAKRERATPYMAALAGFAMLLHRVTGAEDLVIGTTHAGRDRPETEGVVGCFVNTLPLRIPVRPGDGFRRLLGQVRETVLAADAHAAVPFDTIVRAINPDRSLGHNPLFQVMLDTEPISAGRLRLPHVTTTPLTVTDRRVSLFDLSLTLTGDTALTCEYSTELFDEETVTALLSTLPPLLAAALANPDRPVSELPLTRTRPLTPVTEPRELVPTPGATVVDAASGEVLGYADLEANAARLADRLSAIGVGRGALVAVCCARSVGAIVAIRGVHRAGAAYLPIDPDQPPERIAALLELARPAAIVSAAPIPGGGTPVVIMEPVARDLPQPDEPEPPDPDDVAYVMFTSGSTGRPKAVEVTHRGLAAYASADLATYGVSSADTVLQFGSLSFDLSAEEIFPALAAGATLVLRSEDMLDSPQAFMEAVGRHGVTVAHLPTSYLNLLCAEDGIPVPDSLRLVVIGSEPADPGRLARWQSLAPHCRLAHAYGVTEASMVSTIALLGPVADRPRVTIGWPIAGTELHVLDRNLEPLPDGVPGEIYLGGAGLARGYLRAPATTADRFVPDPFATGKRLYRTGDQARRRADGSYEIIGRLDRQLSLHGYRIEPGEVEAALLTHPAVREAAVTVRADRLVAYLTPMTDPADDLRAHAARLLPGHLVPTAYVWLPALPTAGSGKIDLAALPELEPVHAERKELVGETQRILAEIWGDVLGVERVGADDDFFALGGHSLSAARVAARMRRRLAATSGVRLLFEHPRLADAAAAIDRGTQVRCLHELVAEQARLRPEAVAATCAGQSLTYRELDRRARLLAGRLRAEGVAAESIVGVCLERSLDVPIGLLAVLHAGAAYLPLEPDYPLDRLRYMIEDSGTRVVIADPTSERRLPDGLRVIRPDAESGAVLDSVGDPDALAYVIYTSGSTGQPKGVAVPHRAVARRVKEPAWLPLGAQEVFLFTTPMSFDVSVLELFGCLTNGHTLAILPAGKALPERVARFLATEPVTVTWLTAALFHAVVDCAERPFPTVRWLIAGGDQLSADHVRRAADLVPNGRVMNGYGPTEATIFTTVYPIPPGHTGHVPIGEALPYTRLQIVDGELLVGGEGLARGYLGRPALTAERFIPCAGGGRLYRTGDLVRRHAGGPLEFHGRADQQVKIRGFRVELAEIEHVLRDHPSVRDTVVTAPPHDGDRRVVAYVVAEGVWPGASELLRHARVSLPDYMVPARFVLVDALPVSPNGKVDRAALPRPVSARPDLDGQYVAPRDPLEATLAGIWAGLLDLDRVGVHDDFFDIGGHSLLAGRVLARIRRTFERELSLAEFFAAPTVAHLTQLLEAQLRSPDSARRPITPASREGAVPVSLGQRRLWFVDGLAGGGRDYSVLWPLRLLGHLDVSRLASAITGVVGRQEALRSRFVNVDGEPMMIVDPAGPVPVVEGHHVDEVIAEERLRAFDLATGPIARFRLVRVGAQEHVLVVSAHHIVFDGWSGSVFLRDLAALYNGEVLPDLAVSCADFAVWEREVGAADDGVGYWRRALSGASPVLPFPLDRPRPPQRTGAGDRVRFTVAQHAVTELVGVCRQAGATLFMGLLGVLNIVVSRYCGVKDVVVGTFASNRGLPELEELIGFFVNTLVLRTDLSGNPGFAEVVARSRETAIGAFAHQEVPFDRVVAAAAPVRVPGVTPFVQVALVVQNTPGLVGELGGGVRIESVPVEVTTAAFDLSIQVWEMPEGTLEGFVEYSTELFDRATAERFVTAFCLVLETGSAEPDAPVAQLPLTPPGDVVNLVGAEPEQSPGLVELFRLQVAARPDAVAFRADGEDLTYRQLDQRARAVAGRLAGLGVGPEDVVGVRLPSGLDLAVALFGVLYAGAAYLPLDPGLPSERLDFMVKDSGAVTVLSDVDGDGAELPLPAVHPETIAAVIYTSGSTGRPKGVAITGRSIVNRLAWMWRESPFTAGEVGCQKTAPSFVDSLWELLGPPLAGVPTVVLPASAVRDPRSMVEELAAGRVTRMLLVPSLLRVLLRTVPDLGERLPHLRIWVSSGEPLPVELARLFEERLPGRTLVNLYGASEAWDALCTTGQATGPSVGLPITGVRALVLDAELRPVPAGVPGELYIGGRCLARGYLGRPALTAERFIPCAGGGRLYRTGDLARLGQDGVELLGRTDHQVKIRGVRVEPAEVEAILETLPEVRQAAVVAIRNNGETKLVAHVAGDPTTRLLARMLPAHLVPAHLVVHDALPRTATGKIDRQALIEAGVPGTTPDTTAELTGLEARIAHVWSAVFGRDVGRHDNFFDVGGHSLLAPVLAAQLSGEFARDLPLSWVFDHPTVHAMSLSLEDLS